MKIDWHSSSSEILLNPRLSSGQQEGIRTFLRHFHEIKGHVWIATSGSTGNAKWAALSKEAILASAQAVNTHLQSNAEDRWLNPLPPFHVGGLGIWARSYLSGAAVIPCTWNPEEFHRLACQTEATLSSLVPAQVYDLVMHHLQSPNSLRAIFVGGGMLQEPLFHKAAALGWKLMPCYGLTENSSQVAAAAMEALTDQYPPLHILPHNQVEINAFGCIKIKGPALLTGYAMDSPSGPTFSDPKIDGWFHTEDLGQLSGNILSVWGRKDNRIKIGGETVDFQHLERRFEAIKLDLKIKEDAALVAVPDERLGYVIHAATTTPHIHALVDRFHLEVMPFERIRHIHMLPQIPRTALGKLQRAEILEAIHFFKLSRSSGKAF